MKSNYRNIGDFIRLVDERNKGLKVTNLVGLSISKQFIKSVANTIGTDMENYKIIRKNQFACSTMQVRRDKKMPLALYSDGEPAIISQAYPVFEIIDTSIVSPEYLMMWFTRSEFDREACFHAVGGVRGSLEWEDFCGMQLPIPTIEKQQEIVREYNTIVNRITLNEQLNKKLEETAQAIYKEWFVDFEFPDECGKSYKSSGGKMDWCKELEKEIPEGWEVKPLEEVSSLITDGSHTSPESVENGIPMASVKDMEDWGLNLLTSRKISEIDYEKLKKSNCKPLKGDILIAKDGSYLKHIFVIKKEEKVVILSSIAIIRPNLKINPDQLALYLKLDSTKKKLTNVVNGGAIQRIILKEFCKFPVLVPSLIIQNKAKKLIDPFVEKCWRNSKQNEALLGLREILLVKMTKVEIEKQLV